MTRTRSVPAGNMSSWQQQETAQLQIALAAGRLSRFHPEARSSPCQMALQKLDSSTVVVKATRDVFCVLGRSHNSCAYTNLHRFCIVSGGV